MNAPRYIAQPLPQGPHPSTPRPARTPYVEMSKPAAVALASDLLLAMNAAINRGWQCHALQAFYVAHCEAHGLDVEP